MNPNPPTQAIEVEAKFLGGKEEFARITDWLKAQGFSAEYRDAVQRFHIYFDDADSLRAGGCRLRCVIAVGEWCRYDFKADHASGATLEISVKKDRPAPIPEIIDQLVGKVPVGSARSRLEDVRDTARMILTLLGNHQKVVFCGSAVELEVSWDVLTSVESGSTISEVEVELVSGERSDFEKCITLMTSDLNLQAIHRNKLDRFLGAVEHGKQS